MVCRDTYGSELSQGIVIIRVEMYKRLMEKKSKI